MADYRIFPSASHEGEPVRIDLNRAPEISAYMASDDEIAYVSHPDHVERLTRSLQPSVVAIGPAYDSIV